MKNGMNGLMLVALGGLRIWMISNYIGSKKKGNLGVAGVIKQQLGSNLLEINFGSNFVWEPVS